MSDDKGGPGAKDGQGGKKPRATFGDVMLGIPTRSADDRGSKGGKGGDRGERRDRKGGERDEKREEKPRAKGPMVVVKRASGVVETRTEPAAASAGSEPSAPAAEGTAPAAEAESAAPVAPSPLYEEVPENQSFAEMFAEKEKAEGGGRQRLPRIGEKVKGPIFQLGADTAFISLNGKQEAMIELRELKDEEGILRHGVGDVIEAHVIEVGAKGILLSRAITKGSASMALLAEARASGMPVEGMVLSVNKGGYEVAIGDVRAFVPMSQMDTRFVEKPEDFIGEKFKFRVTELRDKGVVLSRRSLLEEEQRAKASETRKSLAEGKVVRGKVISVRDFGAFVDLGGVEGMIPVSEMAHHRVGHPSEVVKVGDEVEVEIIKLEAPQPTSPDKGKHKERITLSLRARQEDPFKAAIAELKEGATVKGKIVRLQPFGAFVELKPGVDGLIHVSALSNRRIAHPRDVVKVGDEVTVRVEKIDPAEKRIGLRLVREGEEEAAAAPEAAATERKPQEPRAPRPKVGQVVEGTVDRLEPFGVFVSFPGGKGLIPASETGTDRGTDLKRHFSLGQKLKVSVLEIDATGKIRLSITGAQKAEERAELEDWKKKQGGGAQKGFGTLGDLLKAKLNK